MPDDTLVDTEVPGATLREAKYDAEQLRIMLGNGHAIKNEKGEPSYPIGDVEDLERAIRAVGRGGGSHDRIRAHIIKRAKALGKSNLIPDNWTSGGEKKESAGPAEAIHESAALVSEALDGQGRRRRIRLIDAGWSKNGRYYPAQTLAEAARAGIYKAGTSMFIDHPTVSEQVERPERSVKDLAAMLVTDARYEGGALVAEAELFSLWRPVINEMADHIGVSIRAAGVLEYGEADGREGPIVTSLTEGISVDFVTSPARGGKILELVEAARTAPLAEAGSAGAWLEARLHLAFTEMADSMYGEGRLTRTERIALSSAVGEALAAFVAKVEAEQPQLYQRGKWQSPPEEQAAMAEAMKGLAPPFGKKPDDEDEDGKAKKAKPDDDTDTGEAEKKAAAKKTSASEADRDAPGSPPADTNTEKKGEGSMPELTEAEARKLTEERDAALAEAETARNEAAAAAASKTESDLALARFTAAEAARPIAAHLLTESGLPAAAQGRLIGELVTSANVPLTGEHRLDESAFRQAVADAIKTEESYLASLAEQAGIGSPRGLGESTTTEDTATVSAEVTEGLVESYKQSGMSEAAARLAATGRPF